MAEFMEVMATRRRLCESTDHCGNCPIVKADILQRNCYHLMNESPEYVEQKVMQWAKEHPIKTNADKFKEMFGIGIHDTTTHNCVGLQCPNFDADDAPMRNCNECKFSGFWGKEYQPKGEE